MCSWQSVRERCAPARLVEHTEAGFADDGWDGAWALQQALAWRAVGARGRRCCRSGRRGVGARPASAGLASCAMS